MKIIDLISEDKYTTMKKLSKNMKISEVAIYHNLTKLKEKGILKRMGPDKSGYWKILK